MMINLQEVLSLRGKTGASLRDCKRAIDYAKMHDKCTPIGYLKAIGYAVATPGTTFEERVRLFSKDAEEEKERQEGEA